jgi:hypothetical protein
VRSSCSAHGRTRNAYKVLKRNTLKTLGHKRRLTVADLRITECEDKAWAKRDRDTVHLWACVDKLTVQPVP